MPERRVWIVQCLCGPARHCITAISGEAETTNEIAAMVAELRSTIADMISKKVINPRCGICGATIDQWIYEPGRTRFRTLDEAMPKLREEETKQILTGAVFGEILTKRK